MSAVAGLPRALISLGTNTTRLLVVRDTADGTVEQLERGSIGTRLGEGLRERGALADEAMRRTLEAVERLGERARAHGAALACIATSAMRRASNSEEFGRRIAGVTGASLHILDGREEAQDSFVGATFGAPSGKGARVAVIDVGGGSTECAAGEVGRLEDATSLEIGAVRLAERFGDTTGSSPPNVAAEAAREARREVAGLTADVRRYGPIHQAFAVGGTPLTIGAIVFESEVESVSGRALRRNELDFTIERMLALNLAARKALRGMLPQRADILPAGGIILSEVMRALEVDDVTLQENDLLLGYLLRNR